MSEFKGTPGPWKASRGADQVMYIDCPDGDGDLGHAAWFGMAIVYGCSEMGPRGHKKAVANASLMAAAPDLLHELTEADKTLCVLQANVADAQTREPRWEGVWQEIQTRRDSINAAIAKALGEDHE